MSDRRETLCPFSPCPHFGEWKRDTPWAKSGRFWLTTYSRRPQHRTLPEVQIVQVRLTLAEYVGDQAENFIRLDLNRAVEMDQRAMREPLRPIYKRMGRRR